MRPGIAVIGYRAPTFSVVRGTLWSLEVLVEAGFQYDSSIFPIVHDRYGIPDAPRFPHRLAAGPGREIAEFPLSTIAGFGWRFPVAGGGYFRLLPYAVTQWAIRQLNRHEGQPGHRLSPPLGDRSRSASHAGGPLAHLRHSVNTHTTALKLRRLLRRVRVRASPGRSCRSRGLGRGTGGMKILAVVGARPNFVKIAPIMAELAEYPYITTTLVHTGQHYDAQMSDSFFANLEIPEPDLNLKVQSTGRDRADRGDHDPA